MRVLMVHNYYQIRGGEDESTEQDFRLLKNHGHDVYLYSRNNQEIANYEWPKRLLLFIEPSWSIHSYKEISKLIDNFHPDVVHVQNFFPLISPSVFYACSRKNIPVLYNLRNYRLLCPTGQFFRDNKVCEDCKIHSLWHGIWHGCYQASRLKTTSIVLMLKIHRAIRTWERKIDYFIALSEFSRQKFINSGIKGSRILLRPNFLERDPGLSDESRSFALFVGRLSPEKGLGCLIKAWKDINHIPLIIIGDGPLRPWLESYIKDNNLDNIKIIGFQNVDNVYDYMKRALFVVVPSLLYETFGRTVIEAYANGTPVIASNIGAIRELVVDGETGLLFSPGSSEDLIAKVNYSMSNTDFLRSWGYQSRKIFEEKYSAKIGYKNLEKIFNLIKQK
jgi:glycosyltransferase involved in cell wall biosynthesis